MLAVVFPPKLLLMDLVLPSLHVLQVSIIPVQMFASPADLAVQLASTGQVTVQHVSQHSISTKTTELVHA